MQANISPNIVKVNIVRKRWQKGSLFLIFRWEKETKREGGA